MVRHYYSYWLTIKNDDPTVLAQAKAWLLEHDIVPDYLHLSDEEPASLSYDVGEYGSIEETGDIFKALKELAEEMPSLCIIFDENDEDDHSIQRSHYWRNGAYAMDATGEANDEELRLKAEDPERYEVTRAKRVLSNLHAKLNKGPNGSPTALLSELFSRAIAEIDCMQAKGKEPAAEEPMYRTLAGWYCLVTARAHLSDDEFKALSGEYPMVTLAVEQSYLLDYINGLGYSSLSEFFSEYTSEDTDGLEGNAELNHALGFVHAPESDEPFRFPDKVSGQAMLAFADFLSGMLQDAGYEDASKHLDCLLDL